MAENVEPLWGELLEAPAAAIEPRAPCFLFRNCFDLGRQDQERGTKQVATGCGTCGELSSRADAVGLQLPPLFAIRNPLAPLSNDSSSLSIPSPSTHIPPIVMLTLPISTKLDRENYLSWHSQIVPLLHGYGLYQFLEDLAPSPTIATATGVQQPNPAFLPWYKQDQMLLGWLRSSLTREILAQVVSAKTSADLWLQLQKSFSKKKSQFSSKLKECFTFSVFQ